MPAVEVGVVEGGATSGDSPLTGSIDLEVGGAELSGALSTAANSLLAATTGGSGSSLGLLVGVATFPTVPVALCNGESVFAAV